MRKNIAINTAHIEWKMEKNAPKSFNIGTELNIKILNPIKYGKIYIQYDMIKNVMEIEENSEVLFSTNGLILSIETEKEVNDVISKLGEHLLILLKTLRIVSKQYFLNPSKIVLFARQLPSNLKSSEMKPTKSLGAIFRKDYYNNRASYKLLRETIKIVKKNQSIPHYQDLFLDTVFDYHNGNYRKTILYSAVTLEAFLATIFDEKYSKIINSKKTNIYRVIKKEKKDPIYEYIKKKNDFYALLHELPIYLGYKSIKLENNVLYKQIDTLHKTRNKIVHLGDVIIKENDNNEYLKITEEGANEAIKILVDTLKYFGVNNSDIIARDFIRFTEN